MTGRIVVGETEIPGSRCTRCGSSLTHREFSDSTEETVCSRGPDHDGEACARAGHGEVWGEAPACPVCAAEPTQWVRVEVREGKAYTYASFESPPLTRGEEVRLPGNVVKSEFTGTVLREIPGPDDDYPGPYKAVLRRVGLSPEDKDLL